MQKLPDVTALDLAALLCSRVCHDIISPVGAIANGLELMEEGADAETREMALALIRTSSANASAKLMFARIAFGAAGSAGAAIDTGEAEAVARGYFANEKKITLEWHGMRALMPKNQVKLLLNLLLVAMGAIPRGGNVKVEIEDPNGKPKLVITATGSSARVPAAFLALLNGRFDEQLDAHAVQPLYALKLAEAAKFEIAAMVSGESVVFSAGPVPQA